MNLTHIEAAAKAATPGPLLEDFCNLANALYAAPTEERFYAVVNLARELLAQSAARWDEGYKFANRPLRLLTGTEWAQLSDEADAIGADEARYLNVRAFAEAVQRKFCEVNGLSIDDPRACTCHPDDLPPRPCPRKYALDECRLAHILSMQGNPIQRAK